MLTIQQAYELALRHHRTGRLVEAEALFRQILAVQPNHPEALLSLGDICARTGSLDEAIAQYRRALQIHPNRTEGFNNLGITLARRGRSEEAIAALRQAIAMRPEYPEAQNNLGVILAGQGRFDEAIAVLRQALQSKPDSAEIHMNLGNALRNHGKLEQAVETYHRALELKSDYPDACNNLGIALAGLGRLGEAVAAHRRALELKPNAAEFHNNLGTVMAEQGYLDEAMKAYQCALQIEPNHAIAQNSLANCLRDQGRIEEAIAAYRRALELQPDEPLVHSNLIYTLHFHPSQDEAGVAEEQHRWNRFFGEPVKGGSRPYSNIRDTERRLRIGYVSPDFRDHVVGRNLLPLFKNHDRESCEIVFYSGVVYSDKMTDECRDCADHWRSTVGVADEALAEMIRQDGVDVLVDLTQHMAGNRLPVFARRPAPVQVSFAGYPESTGVEAIEYRISDRYLESEGSRAERSERVHLIDSFWCYDPCGLELEVNALPAQESGRITFGSLNSFCKISEPLLRLWARVLTRVKESNLMLLSGLGSHRQRTLEFLEQQGIASQRVEFVESRPRRAYLELYHRLDIVLDTFPYNGHTTSLDALWMGVPVVSLAGQCAISRAGRSQLSNLGLRDLIACSPEKYVESVERLARDLPRVAELRKTLRRRMKASVLMDAPHFARSMEAAYRAMWRGWCAEQTDK